MIPDKNEVPKVSIVIDRSFSYPKPVIRMWIIFFHDDVALVIIFFEEAITVIVEYSFFKAYDE